MTEIVKKYNPCIGIFHVCQQQKSDLSAMFTDLDRLYFGTANTNSGADLELNNGIPPSINNVVNMNFPLYTLFLNDVFVIEREKITYLH